MNKIYIDSITGRRVSKAYATANPTTTQSQTVKPRTETSKLLTKFKKAIAGLMYLSESEYPFEVFKGKVAVKVNPETLLRQIRRFGESCKERDAVKLSDSIAANADTEATREQIRKLRAMLEDLESFKVFAVGEIQVSIYFVGLSKDGVLCGVLTISIET